MITQPAEIWYALSAFRDAEGRVPVGVRVEVVWNGRQFHAAIARNSTGKLQWGTIKNGEIEWLPPSRRSAEWGSQPEAWRPISAWPHPLPESSIRRTCAPQLYSSTMRFHLVEDASAADLAREMEHTREAARAHRDYSEEYEEDKRRWWCQPFAPIKYEPAGSVTREMAEGRLMRAVAACGANIDKSLKSPSASQALADLSDAANEAFKQTDATSDGRQRFRPQRPDIQDFGEAMRWFTALNPPRTWLRNREPWSFNRMQKVLLFKALPDPLNWREIGTRIKRTSERSRQLYAEAITMACRIANSPNQVTAEMEALRERNRAFRRAG